MKLVVAHYGRQVPENPIAALTEWSDWVAEHIGAETHLTANFLVSADGHKDGEAYRSDIHKATLCAELERGNVAQLTLTSMASKPSGYMAFEYDWTALLDVTTGRFGPACVLVLDADEQQSTSDLSALCDAYGVLARRLINTGYAFIAAMPQDFMPIGYSIGLACGGAPEEFVYDANAWRRYARKECDRSLRNVFGYNILNDAHLNLDVGGEPLEAWVSSGSGRGQITPLSGDLHVWTFQKADPSGFLLWDCAAVVAVREQLKQHRFFPWQRLPGVE
ncbi:MAG: hypothetical protein RIC55_29050 [Pirellulaceae bacterium]